MNSPRVTAVAAHTALNTVCRDLLLPLMAANDDIQTIVAAVARRLCGIMCPCPQHSVVAATLLSLRPLVPPDIELDSAIAEVIDNLLIGGDILELAHVAATELRDKPTWLFCAPPSFIELDGRVYIFGIAPDNASFLSRRLEDRVCYEGAMRFIDVLPDEGVGKLLESTGLRRVLAENWLDKESKDSPATFLKKIESRIQNEGVAGPLPGVTILRHAVERHCRYGDRWDAPASETGLYIGRVEQAYGAPLWYASKLQEGVVLRSMLLPLAKSKSRACDAAWRIQLAIDTANGHPATYDLCQEIEGYRLSTSFPLPIGARRRLLWLGGTKGRALRDAGKFWIPNSTVATTQELLETGLWLRPRYDSPLGAQE